MFSVCTQTAATLSYTHHQQLPGLFGKSTSTGMDEEVILLPTNPSLFERVVCVIKIGLY